MTDKLAWENEFFVTWNHQARRLEPTTPYRIEIVLTRIFGKKFVDEEILTYHVSSRQHLAIASLYKNVLIVNLSESTPLRENFNEHFNKLNFGGRAVCVQEDLADGIIELRDGQGRLKVRIENLEVAI